ncbi:MAG TPA: hypothetical protein VHW44_28130 [Pseudonocardiaceae bacterium]|nr:hypothetical protein [Pseudonocardiaceae bacterium]
MSLIVLWLFILGMSAWALSAHVYTTNLGVALETVVAACAAICAGRTSAGLAMLSRR